MMLWRLGAVGLALALVIGMLMTTLSSQPIRPVPNLAIERNLALATGKARLKRHEQVLSGGVLQAVLAGRIGEAGGRAVPAAGTAPYEKNWSLGCPNVFTGLFANVRVNQDCSFRRQAEEQIVIDPTDSTHLIAGQNDSRIGFNHCGIDFSFDRGAHWGDQLPPFWQFILKDGHTSDAASDPALAFDSQGNAYFACIVFDVISAANALVVAKSNAAFGGTFFHTPVPSSTQHLRTVPLGVVANDNDPTIFNDKEFMAADSNLGSPKRDRVYMTWTRFRFTATGVYIESPIFFSQSADGGATWSGGVEISGAGSACVLGNSVDPTIPPNECNFDQGSWPLVGPDGTLYIMNP